METRQMRYFLAVADTGTFTAAAERLGVAQPALSQAIARMEAQLGSKLFQRSRRGARLTLAGQAILDTVRLSVMRIDEASLHAREIAEGKAGKLTVGFVATALYRILPATLRQFRVAMPNVSFTFVEMSNTEQAHALEKGEIDIGLLFTPVEVGGRMQQRVLLLDDLIAAVPEGFPTDEDGKVMLRDVAARGLVFAPQEQVPLMRAQILSAIRQIGEEGRIVQEAHRIVTVLACVAGHLGVSLLPSSTASLSFPGVQFRQVKEIDLLPRIELSAIWPLASRRRLVDEFAEALQASP